VDGVTFNFTTNGTQPECRTEIENIGTIIDEIKALYEEIITGQLDIMVIITFLQKVQTTIYGIASDCQFLELYLSLVSMFNPWSFVINVLSILIFKIPSLAVAEYDFFRGLFSLDAYLMGFGSGRNLSILTGWEIY